MKKTIFIWTAAVITGCALFVSCKKENHAVTLTDEAPYLNPAYNYESVNEVLITNASGQFVANTHTVTNAGASLGRALFYDKKLSDNNMVACASCHKQEFAFADNVSFSNGFNGGQTTRNSMAIVNAITSSGFFWDNRTIKLEDMVLQPIRHQVEMGLTSSDFMVEKLSATSYYPQLFQAAFGTTNITKEEVGSALAQFLYSMFSQNSRADQAGVISASGGGWNTTNSILTVEEQQGASLFQGLECTDCHAGTDVRGWNNGLTWGDVGLDSVYKDNGLGALLSNPAFNGVFKVPSLRNIALTAPYFHDGRYTTLDQVVDHYNSGVMYNANLSMEFLAIDPITRQPLKQAKTLGLTSYQKGCLVAFLKTLTDYNYTDPKFSDPYKNQ
jgi:cytochrome c peroxidase